MQINYLQRNWPGYGENSKNISEACLWNREYTYRKDQGTNLRDGASTLQERTCLYYIKLC